MKLYQTKDGYTLINHECKMYDLVRINTSGQTPRYIHKFCGTVGVNTPGTGTLLKNIPNHIKTLCFSLNKKTE